MHIKNFIIWIIVLAQVSTIALAGNPCQNLLLVNNSPIVMPVETRSHIIPRTQMAAAERLYHEFRQVGPTIAKALDKKQREFLMGYIQGNATQADTQLFAVLLQDIVVASEQNGVLRRQAREEAANSVDGITGYSPLAPQPTQRGFKAWIARMYNAVVDAFKGPRVHFEYTSGFVSQLSQISDSSKRMKAIRRAIAENRMGQPLTLTEVVYILSTITHNLTNTDRDTVAQLFNLVSRETFSTLSYAHQLMTLEALYSLPIGPIEEDQVHIGRASVGKQQFLSAANTSPSLVVKHLDNATSRHVFSYNFSVNQNEFLATAEKEPRLASFLEEKLVLDWETVPQLIEGLKTVKAAHQLDVFKRSLPGHSLKNISPNDVLNLVAAFSNRDRSDVYTLVREQVGRSPFQNQTLDQSLALLSTAETLKVLGAVSLLAKDLTITPSERDVLNILVRGNSTELAQLAQHRGRLNMNFTLLSSDVLGLVANDASAAQRLHSALPVTVGISTPFNAKIVELLKAVPAELRLAFLERILVSKASTFKFTLSELADVLSVFPSSPLIVEAYSLIGSRRHHAASTYNFMEQLELVGRLPLGIATSLFQEIPVSKSELLSVNEQHLAALRQILLVNFDLRLFKFEYPLTAQEIMALASKGTNLDAFLAINLVKLDFQQTRTTQAINDLIAACISIGFPEANLVHLRQMQTQLTAVVARIESARAAAVLAARPRGRQQRGSTSRTVARRPAPPRATASEVQQKYGQYLGTPRSASGATSGSTHTTTYVETPVYIHDFNIPWYYYTLDPYQPVVVEHHHFHTGDVFVDQQHHVVDTTIHHTVSDGFHTVVEDAGAYHTPAVDMPDWNMPDATHFLDQAVSGFSSEPTTIDEQGHHHTSDYSHADAGVSTDAVVEDSWISNIVQESAASYDSGNSGSSSYDSGGSSSSSDSGSSSSYDSGGSSSGWDSGSSSSSDSSSSYDSGSSSSYDSGGSSSSYDSGSSSSYDSGSSSSDSGSSGGGDW